MGRRRKIFTQRELDKLSKTHEGRIKIITTYLGLAVMALIASIVVIIVSFFFSLLKVFRTYAFIGAAVSIFAVLIFIILYKSENAEEQERVEKAKREQQRKMEMEIARKEHERAMEEIRLQNEKEKLLKFKNSNMDEIDKMNGYQFESFISAILEDLGYITTTTNKSGDFGVDVIVEKENRKIIIQTKRYAKKVSLSAVQEITSAKNYYGIQNAWVVTNNYFTEPAKELAKANNITLIDRDELADIIIEAKNIRDSKAKSA